MQNNPETIMRNHKKKSLLGTIRHIFQTIFQKIQRRRSPHILSIEGKSIQKTSSFLTDTLKKRGVQLFILIAILVIASYQFGRSQRPTSSVSQQRTLSQVYSKVIRVDQSVELPVTSGKEKETVIITFTTAEKTDQVVVDDKEIRARQDKLFLIANFEIDNNLVTKATILPAEVIRLVTEKDKKFAPDLHNNQIDILPISTKIDRVGFVISKDAKDLKLQVGPLTGEKKIIQLSF